MWYRFVQLLFRVLFSIFFRLETIGRENIPHEGPVVIASNHVSLRDPPMIGTAASRPIHFMAKSELFVRSLESFQKGTGSGRESSEKQNQVPWRLPSRERHK